MASKQKRQSTVAAIIPPIDPNSHLLFAGNHMSIISESDLFHLVEVGFCRQRNSVLGGSVVESLFQQRTPMNLLSTCRFLSVDLLFPSLLFPRSP
jgi:ABC-type iron transport system FetAB ATPase subunit